MKPRRGRVVVPSVGAGLLLAFSLPPWGWWPLGFVGAAVLFVALRGLRLRSRVLAGWVAGMGCFVPGLWWAASFNWYGAVVLMAVEAVSCAVAAALVPSEGTARVAAFAGAFTLMEAARMTWPFGGLPLGGVYLGQADGPALGAARLGGPLLLTALVWLGGAAAGSVVLAAATSVGARRAWDPVGAPTSVRPARWGSLAGVLAALVVVAASLGGALAPDGGRVVRTLSVAAVQGGGRRGTTAREVEPQAVFAAQVAATADLRTFRASRPTRSAPARLVVWPEDVIAVGRRLAGTRQAARMASIARSLGATVVAGVTQTVSATAFRNEAVVWAPDGQVVAVYEKVHRVPFGEYVPDRAFFAHFANLQAVPLDAVPGHGTGELATPAGRIGVMLSYEVFFAARGRAAARAGAELLVVPTNTSSYATSQVPAAEVAADRVQAVSEGRDLVQAAPTGYSTVVEPSGRIERRSVLGRRQVLTATVGLRTGATVYERFGDVPVLVLSAAALVLGLDFRRRARRWRRSPGLAAGRGHW